MRCAVFRSTPSLPLLPIFLLLLSFLPTLTSALLITILDNPLQIKVNQPTLVRWQHQPSDPPGFDFRFVIDERDVGLARANIVVDRPEADEGFVEVRFPRPGIYEIKAVAGPGPRFRVIGTSNEVVVRSAAATTLSPPTPTITSSTSSSSTGTPSASPESDSGALTSPSRAGLIAGLILGSLILVCLLVLLTIFVLRHRRLAQEKNARLSFYPEQMVQAVAPTPTPRNPGPDQGNGGGVGGGMGGVGGVGISGIGGIGGIGGMGRRETMSERGSRFLSRLTSMTRTWSSFSSSRASSSHDIESGLGGRGRGDSNPGLITPFPLPSELPPPPTPSTRSSHGMVQHLPDVPVSAKPTVISFTAVASPRAVTFTNPFETPAERDVREREQRKRALRPLPTPPVSANKVRPLPQVPQPPSSTPPVVRDPVSPRTPRTPLPVLPPICATPPLSIHLERHRALPIIPVGGKPTTPNGKTERQRILEDRVLAVQERMDDEEFRARVRLSEEMSIRNLGLDVPEDVRGSGHSRAKGKGKAKDVEEGSERDEGVWTPQMDDLRKELAWLKSALESDWARGRSDVPPAGYSRYLTP